MDIEDMTEERAGELIMTARAPGLPEEEAPAIGQGNLTRSYRVSGVRHGAGTVHS